MISMFTNLTYLALGSNRLRGTIPESLGTLAQLSFIDLTNNFLTGNIHSNLCKQGVAPSFMTDLLISSNQLNGSLGECQKEPRSRVVDLQDS